MSDLWNTIVYQLDNPSRAVISTFGSVLAAGAAADMLAVTGNAPRLRLSTGANLTTLAPTKKVSSVAFSDDVLVVDFGGYVTTYSASTLQSQCKWTSSDAFFGEYIVVDDELVVLYGRKGSVGGVTLIRDCVVRPDR